MMRSLFQRLRLFTLVLLMAALGGCAGVDPQTYAQENPTLDLFRYFSGDVDAWGHFSDRSGKVVKRFTVAIRGTVAGDTLTLDERFSYSDGSKSQRVWTIRRTAPGQYTGTADDVIGSARGVTAGNALQWNYVLALPVDGRTWQVDFDDWMYLQDETMMLNKSVMSKFGIRLGEVLLAFRKRG